jgi:phosphate transporter
MVRFGKQLELGIYDPWKSYYMQYSRLKRIITRRKFAIDKLKEMENKSNSNSKPTSPLETPTVTPRQTIGKSYSLLNNEDKDNPIAISTMGNSTGTLGRMKRSPSLARIVTQLASSAPNIPQASEFTPINHSPARKSYEKLMNAEIELKSRGYDGKELDESIDFFSQIREELDKVDSFYQTKITELKLKLDDLTSHRYNPYRSHHTSSSELDITNLRDIYIELVTLKNYCELNGTGFYKIIKKYDKTMEEKTLDTWMNFIGRKPFSLITDLLSLCTIIESLVSREKLLEWERSAFELQKLAAEQLFPGVRPIGLIISILLFIASKFIPLINKDAVAGRCLQLLILTVSLWITEAIPYFATGIAIPFLVTVMGVLKDDKDPTKMMNVETAAQFCVNHVFNHTTMLLLGGYTISNAFSRCHLELHIASILQVSIGENPKVFILAIMMVGLFLSMLINNHTAPILCATIIMPILKDIPTNTRFSKCLLLGLAFSCNFGGMMSPISSLQNALAVSYLANEGILISFGRWLLIAFPFCIVCTIATWVFMVQMIDPSDVPSIPFVVNETDTSVSTKKSIIIIVLSGITVLMFATSSMTNFIFGDISIISLGYVALMFGTGMLTEVDFNSLPWHTLFLVGGGNVLGKAVDSSGLLEYIVNGIIDDLPLESPWLALMFILRSEEHTSELQSLELV